uniref:Uncharacterized protein n=1 Tax=Fagus sylvatica TaxID=28930 RepID=A0A2N9GBY9_FAGSY
MSAKLIFLHSETFDLSGTRISENDQGNTSEVAKDMESSVRLNTERQQVESFNLGLHEMDSQEQLKAISDIEELRTSQHDPLGEFYEMETERGNVEVADAVNCSQEPLKAISDIEELRTSQHDPLGEFNEIETDRGFVEVADGPSLMDKTDDASASLQIDASCMSPDNKLDARTIEGDAFIVDMSNEKAIDAIEIVEHGIEISAHLQSDCLEPAENIKASLASECHNLAFENGNQPLEEAGNDKPGALSEDGVLPADSNCDEKDPTSSFMCMGEIKIDSIHSVELDLDVNNPSLNVKEHTECQEADRISIMDGEVPVLDLSRW